MRKIMLLLAGIVLYALAPAQLLRVTPAFPTENDAVTIVFDASKGNRGLFGYNGDIYVHTGVITNASNGAGDWKHVPTEWNSNNAAHKLTALGNNLYEYKISNIRTFYNIPPGESIRKLAFVFRSYNPGGNVLEGKCADLTVDQGNMYWDINPEGVNRIRFTLPEPEPRFTPYYPPLTVAVGETLPVTATSSKSAALQLKLNGNVIQSLNNSTINGNPTITSTGQNTLIATSNDGITTVGDTLHFYVAPATIVAPLPAGMKEGINYEGDDAAVLVLFAPGKTRVNLLGDFNNWVETAAFQLNRTPDGKYFWLRLTGLEPLKEYAYQYLVDGSLRIGDPYCEKVLDPQNDPFIDAGTYPSLLAYPTGKTTGIVSVLQTKQESYTWKVPRFERPDKRRLVIYEVLLRDFVANHDWKTLQDSIGYFRSLGVNAIHLMPFNEFEGNLSWGYNPSYYFAPDKFYGPKHTLKSFIDACHQNGIAVIMDMVLNHSFGQSPMVQLYFDAAAQRPSVENPWFNPVARHAFNVGYDMNHESADTKRFFSNVCRFWLNEYKLDGFRFDLSKGFTQKKTCDDNGGNCDVNAWSAYDASRVAIWKAYYDTLQSITPGSYVILEHLGVNNEEQELAAHGMLLWGNMNYNFTEAARGQVSNSNFAGALHSARGWSQPHLISYMESHDEERSMYRCETEGLSGAGHNIREENVALARNEMAAAFMLAIPGPKLIWQFGELGYDYSINYCGNGSVNQQCRTDQKPVRWDYYQQQPRTRLRNVYQKMLSLRQNPYYHELFVSGSTTYDLTAGMKWFKLSSDTSCMLAVGNFGLNASNATVTFPKAGVWYDLLSGEIIGATGAAQTITLPAGGYRIWLNRNLNGTTPTAVGDVEENEGLRLQARPNPVSSSSMVDYELDEGGQVRFTLLDLNGRIIAGFDAGMRARGRHQFSVGTAFPRVPSGMLLLQLQVNGKRKMTKLMVP